MSVYLQDGRHQEEDAGHEAGEGQRHGPGRRLRAAGQGRQPQSREGKFILYERDRKREEIRERERKIKRCSLYNEHLQGLL